MTSHFLDLMYEIGVDTLAQIPQTELFSPNATNSVLPSWLADHEDTFRAALESGNVIANVVLGVLEQELQLPRGAFTSLH